MSTPATILYNELKSFALLSYMGGGYMTDFVSSFISLIFCYHQNIAHLFECHVNVCQVLPQFICSDICHIWKKLKKPKRYFCKIKSFLIGEINEQGFNSTHADHVYMWDQHINDKFCCWDRDIIFKNIFLNENVSITWTNVDVLSMGLLGANFREILIKIQTFSLKKRNLEMLLTQWCPFF